MNGWMLWDMAKMIVAAFASGGLNILGRWRQGNFGKYLRAMGRAGGRRGAVFSGLEVNSVLV
jgi:hypothetical protein